MKLLKLIFFGFLILFVLLFLGVFIFIKTFDVNKYLPQITQQIGNTINRKVNIGHANLDLGLFKGFSLELKNITISDDPQFSRSNFLDLETAYVGLDLMALIKRRQINVTKIILTSPKISVVRLPNGLLNVQTMAPVSSQQATNQTKALAALNAAAPPIMALLAVFIKSISINHAQLSFEDKNAQMPLHLAISDGEIKINNFSLNEPFDFTMSIDAWGQRQNNIDVSGHCRLDLAHRAVHMSGLQIKSDLSQWDWEKVRTITPLLGNLPVWPQEIKGDVSLDVSQLNASSKGLEALSLQIALTDGYVKLKELLSAIDHITLKAESDLNNFSIKQLQGRLGTGQIDVQGDVHGLMTLPSYNFQFQSKSVKVENLFDQSKAPAILNGEADGQFSGSTESFDPQAVLQNLKGEGRLALNNAKIEKFNILKTVLDKLNFIPGLGNIVQNTVETALPSSIKAELDTDTTVLDKAEGKIKVENKTISIQDAQVESKLFSVAAQGVVDFDLNTDIEVKAYLASDISTALTQSAKPLQGLLDERNRLYIPGKIYGKAPSIGYQPQIDYIAKKVAAYEGRQQIGQQLQKVFHKNPGVGDILNAVLGSDQSPNASNPDNSIGQSTNSQSDGQEGTSKKLIDGVLNTIFH